VRKIYYQSKRSGVGTVAGIARHITRADTLEIIKKPTSATSHSVITLPYKIGL
jgi:hypothetical protein